ncbi:hypothetical protein [Paraburkholderia humisilvae]|uniref:Uncharacterized protein n=1 Tax=Paraburkholderia humisilvae TaxID=627669 RepID=A0A6J5DXV2_9BURK|nr:hypothetical protein [Paraburkholderia humisilvae]CAB3758467.1 hypothetical protein LMG29542_03347 [Paraburkholderia humisilvae]
MNSTRPMPPLARALFGLLLLASFGLTLLLIVGTFAGVVAIVRWLITVFAVCPI